MILAVLAALVAAFSFALSTTMHQRAAKRQPDSRALDPRLLFRLVRTRLWQLGWAPDVAGVASQAVALRYGPLAVVQPLLASGLFMAILIEAAWNRRPVQRRDLAATVVGVVGLVAFVVTVDPRAGVADPGATAWWWVAVGTGGVLAACLLAARRTRGAARGALLGVATGVLYGVASALLKSVATRFHGDPAALVLDPRFVALVLVALVGVQLNQSAFQSGRIAAPLTALTLSEPVTGVLIGLTAFHEALSLYGLRIPLVALAAVAIVVGVWLGGTASRADREAAARGMGR
ncbi:DMT family transporter, partial [Micromonospora sp. R77]|uniref:DMT family transporter n=1 Tax=Micromonospora sp. R77 TaxID=2925836 RepID=UPI001F60B443|nr:DMT family transporter [Micromonospora sp. R77]MCI4065918.1 DMT family transporter [Micromonospora sp. R77]MCI4067104.1 DMT family transporter [Micromonospora sp. R77]